MSAPTPPAGPTPTPDPAASPAAPVGPRPGRVGPGRHLLSVVVSVVAVGLAYVGIDYATFHGIGRAAQMLDDGPPPWEASIACFVACLLLLVASACGRVSALGPLVAAIVWGVVPGVLFFLKPITTLRAFGHLPEIYDGFGLGIGSYGPLVFGVVAALLLGTALSGRWR